MKLLNLKKWSIVVLPYQTVSSKPVGLNIVPDSVGHGNSSRPVMLCQNKSNLQHSSSISPDEETELRKLVVFNNNIWLDVILV